MLQTHLGDRRTLRLSLPNGAQLDAATAYDLLYLRGEVTDRERMWGARTQKREVQRVCAASRPPLPSFSSFLAMVEESSKFDFEI